MNNLLNSLEQIGFYQHEETKMISVLKDVSNRKQSPWLLEGRYECHDCNSIVVTEEVEIIEGLLWLHYARPKHRLCFLSREDLYEYLPYAFEEMQPQLETNGITISDIESYETENDDLILRLDGVDHLIFPAVIHTAGVDDIRIKWNFATAKLLLLINQLLSKVESNERIYVIKELDDDGLYISFLTSQMYDLLQQSLAISAVEKPQQIEDFFKDVLNEANSQGDSIDTSDAVKSIIETLYPGRLEQ